jgi:hypothetical protein
MSPFQNGKWHNVAKKLETIIHKKSAGIRKFIV